MAISVMPEKGSRDEAPLDQRSPEQLMDHYLHTTSYYKQTMLSLSTALSSVWRKQCFANGPDATRDKLKMFWTNISLVSALLLAVSYPSAIAPINSDDPDKANAVSIAATFSGLSLVLSLSVIVISVIYLIEIDNCTTERDLTDFIDVNSPVVDILTGIFSASVVLLLAAALTSMFITYGQTEFLIVTCVAGAITLLGIVFASILAGHNRFRLWVRYDSPEGKKMVEKLKRKQMQKLEALKADLIFQEKDLSALKEALDLMDVKERVEGPRMQP